MPSLKIPPFILWFFLFNHGGRLLRPGSAMWLSSMWFLAVAMGTLEGFTWTKILMVFLPPEYHAAAVVFGVIWGFGIWIIDTNFATLDTARDYRKPLTAAAAEAPASGVLAVFRNKLFFGTLVRICIISFSMGLTGPFLAKTLEERKVVQRIEQVNDRSSASLRLRAAAEEDRKIATIEQEIAAARRDLVQETAGHSISGKTGDGPVARAMKLNIASLEERLAQAKTAKAARVQALAQMTPEQMVRQEGLTVLPDNPDTRARLVKEMRKDGEETVFGLPASHVIASSLFLLLFLMMVLLKVYQPRTVAIYLNDHLQEMYDRYLKGGFADLSPEILSPSDRHDAPSPMGAQRFDAWFHDGYLPKHALVEREDAVRTQKAQRDAELGELVEGQARVRRRLLEGSADLEALKARRTDLADRKATVEIHINRLEDTIMETENSLHSLHASDRAARRQDLTEKLTKAEAAKAVIAKMLDERIPDLMAGTVTALQAGLRRLGAVGETAPPSVTLGEEMTALYAERDALTRQRHDLGVQLLELDVTIKALREEFSASGSDGAAFDPRYARSGDPEFEEVRRQWLAARRERDDAVRRQVPAEELEAHDRSITARESEIRQDAELDAHYQRLIREKELERSGARFGLPANQGFQTKAQPLDETRSFSRTAANAQG